MKVVVLQEIVIVILKDVIYYLIIFHYVNHNYTFEDVNGLMIINFVHEQIIIVMEIGIVLLMVHVKNNIVKVVQLPVLQIVFIAIVILLALMSN